MEFDNFGFIHRNDNCNEEELVKSHKGNVFYSNESGTFECDNFGRLLVFHPDTGNLISETPICVSDNRYHPCVRSLIIPEGITGFEDGFFRGGLVSDYLRFPGTLTSIGEGSAVGCVFANTCLPDVEIPDNVRMIGTFAFGKSVIKSVRIPKNFNCEYLRQFKDSRIKVLYLPHGIKKQWHEGGMRGIYSNFYFHCGIERVVFY